MNFQRNYRIFHPPCSHPHFTEIFIVIMSRVVMEPMALNNAEAASASPSPQGRGRGRPRKYADEESRREAKRQQMKEGYKRWKERQSKQKSLNSDNVVRAYIDDLLPPPPKQVTLQDPLNAVSDEIRRIIHNLNVVLRFKAETRTR
jgi:hypothetical protein